MGALRGNGAGSGGGEGGRGVFLPVFCFSPFLRFSVPSLGLCLPPPPRPVSLPAPSLLWVSEPNFPSPFLLLRLCPLFLESLPLWGLSLPSASLFGVSVPFSQESWSYLSGVCPPGLCSVSPSLFGISGCTCLHHAAALQTPCVSELISPTRPIRGQGCPPLHGCLTYTPSPGPPLS